MGSLSVAGLVLMTMPGCIIVSSSKSAKINHGHGHPQGVHSIEDHPPTAIAVVSATSGNTVSGWVLFERLDDEGNFSISAEISGLEPNSTHGFHIHEFGDQSKSDGTSAGGHYNPEGFDHALPGDPDVHHHRHAGDLGNLTADDQGVARFEGRFETFTINDGWNPILGRSIIIHALADNGGQPTGNAGARIGIGVIGIANPG